MSTAVVVGGGPAGLIAAEVLARAGVAVTVYDRMPSPARKLLLAGHGGLNITHSEDCERMLARYGPSAGRLTPMLAAFKERHHFVVDRLNAIPGVKCVESGGAFYAFPDVREAIDTLFAAGKLTAKTDMALSQYLLDHGVALVPGSAFGAEGYIRISFATSMQNLEKAMERIAQALK